MRQLTVAEVLRLALPSETQVAAGAAGLDRDVNWARVAGTRPLAAGSLEEGDLVVFAVLPAALAGDGARRLVELLVDTRAAGLLLIQNAPAALVEAAEAASLPVLVAPPGSRASDLERAVIGLIVDSRSQLRQRADETSQRLTRIALEDRGLGAIVQALADTMAKVVIIEDEYGAVQEAVSPRVGRTEAAAPGAAENGQRATTLPALDGVLAELRARTSDLPWPGRDALRSHRLTPTRLPLGATGLVRLVHPIVLKSTMAGFLSVVGPEEAFDELDDLTLGPAAVVCALEIAKQRAVAETEYRLQADVLEAALSGRFTSEADLFARARGLGYELEDEQIALVFGLDDERGAGRPGRTDDGLGADGASGTAQPRPRLLDAMRRALEAHQRPALVRQHEDHVAVFLPLGGADMARLRADADVLRRDASAGLPDNAVSLGIGRPYPGVGGLSTSYHEAAEALLIGQALLGGACATYFGDLGIRRLLFPLRDSAELREFYDEFLGALDSYDERHGTELIRTLEGFFAHHGNHVRAAEALHLHRNTLLYRLARIQAIGNLDLDDPETRLAVQVALRLRPVSATRRAPLPVSSDDNAAERLGGLVAAGNAHDMTSARAVRAGRAGGNGQA